MEKAELAKLTLGALVSLFTTEVVKTTAGEAIKSLKDGLKSLFSGDYKGERALRNLEKLPEDEDFQKDFNTVLLNALNDDQTRAEVQRLLDGVEQAAGEPVGTWIQKTNSMTVQGDKTVNIQDANNNDIKIDIS